MLFRKKEEKRVIELTAAEGRLLREGLMCFHNKCLHDGKPTEDIAEVMKR
mgnify:CR=1 FL=1